MDRTKSNNNYNDSVVSFNGEPLKDDEVLAPVVLDDGMKTTLKRHGLNYDYCNTVSLPYCDRTVTVAHVPVKKEDYKIAKTSFNDSLKTSIQCGEKNKFETDLYKAAKEVKAEQDNYYKEHYPEVRNHEQSYKDNYSNTCFSYDGMINGIDDEDGDGYDPSADIVPDDKEARLAIIQDLCNDLKKTNREAANIIQMLLDGYPKKEIVKSIGKGKTQSYEAINKALKVLKKEFDNSLKE